MMMVMMIEQTNVEQEPYGRIARDGSLQIYYAAENSLIDQDILMRRSTDGGLTWSDPPTIVAGATTTGRDGMPGCTDFADNGPKTMCVFETTENDQTHFSVKSVVSADDGVTWGHRSQVFVPGGGSLANGSSLPVLRPLTYLPYQLTN